jgi:serine phosphatase RsbU (regulator of sigma subunit)
VAEPSPAQAVARLNRVFCERGWEDRFVTLAMCVLDPQRHEVTVVNAGHLPPLLRSGSRGVEPLGDAVAGLPLGVNSDAEYGQCAVALQPGDCLAMYTDGITEAMNPADDLYGLERLTLQMAGEFRRVAAVGQQILADVRTFVGTRRQSDDMCLAVFGRCAGE